MPGPIQKRLMPVNIDSFDRKHHNVMDLMAGVMGSASGSSKAAFLKDMHTEQYLVCLTYKLIWTNVLPPVDMTVAKLVWHACIKKLQVEGVSTVLAPRAFTRMKCIASVLTVMHALENVFHTPGSENYGKPFEFGLMHAVGPYLVATEEIAIYVLTLMSSAWMNEAEPDCVKALAQLKCKLPPKESAAWVGYNVSNITIKFKVLNEQLDDGALEKFDFDRLVLKGSLDSIAEEVSVPRTPRVWARFNEPLFAAQLSKRTGARIMSKENIKTMLMSMRGRTIKAPKRTGPRPGDIDNGAAKVEMAILEADGEMSNRWFLSTHWALEAGTMYGEKKMLEVIQRVFHRFTRERKIVTGFTYRNEIDSRGDRVVNPHARQSHSKEFRVAENAPQTSSHIISALVHSQPHVYSNEVLFRAFDRHVYQTIMAAPNNAELFKVPNNSGDGGVAFFVADVDLDTYAHGQHMQDAAYSEEATENSAFTSVAEWYTNRWCEHETLDYPRTLLQNSKRVRTAMDARPALNDDTMISKKRRRR